MLLLDFCRYEAYSLVPERHENQREARQVAHEVLKVLHEAVQIGHEAIKIAYDPEQVWLFAAKRGKTAKAA